MKLKISKKLIAIFCSTVMITSALGMSASALMPTWIWSDDCLEYPILPQLSNYTHVMLDDINQIGIDTNWEINELKRQDISLKLLRCKSIFEYNENIIDNDSQNNDDLKNLLIYVKFTLTHHFDERNNIDCLVSEGYIDYLHNEVSELENKINNLISDGVFQLPYQFYNS